MNAAQLTQHIPRLSPMNTQILFLSIFTTLMQVVEKYLFNDWEYLRWLVVLVAIDTLLGMAFAIKARQFSSYGFSKVIVKMLLYGCCLVVINVLTRFTINGETPALMADLASWFAYFLLTVLMLREAISVFENIAKIEPRFLPTWVLARLKSFENQIAEKATTKADEKNPD